MAFYKVVIGLVILLAFLGKSSAKNTLTKNYYRSSCPHLQAVVQDVLNSELTKDPRMLASILRLHFHDCFVNGCDGSILLNDTRSVEGEMGAAPNLNSVRGFEVIETIKSKVEKNCTGVVSCADILTLAARESVVLLGGPSWELAFGRKDGYVTDKNKPAANNDLPKPSMNITELKNLFSKFNFSTSELVALAGAHTVGQARCTNFRNHIYNDTDIDPGFANLRRSNCSKKSGGNDNNLAPLDLKTPLRFDNSYYTNLIAQKGLLHSDQELRNQDTVSAGIVDKYSKYQETFFTDFSNAMTKMSLLEPVEGTKVEIRKVCSKVN